MENNQEILAKLEKHTRQQLLFTRILCILCAAAVVCTLILMFSVTSAATQLTKLAAPLQELTAQMQGLAGEAETVMADLGTVAEALAGADLGSIVENVNLLAADSQSAVAEAMEKLEAIDIEALNKAIKDLAAIVEPLAKISSMFG